ncbi:unnamed protein product [Taenia asiatica]|uniref:Secreted protein n=1 Tax=Taenia asiatica TaxID=60517 RepID=A0A0R3VUZ8_TAEAS|nr:unnamed protein product [Taenia asiatica]
MPAWPGVRAKSCGVGRSEQCWRLYASPFRGLGVAARGVSCAVSACVLSAAGGMHASARSDRLVKAGEATNAVTPRDIYAECSIPMCMLRIDLHFKHAAFKNVPNALLSWLIFIYTE